MRFNHRASFVAQIATLAAAGSALAAEAPAPANPDANQVAEIVVHGTKRDTTAVRTPAQVSVFGDQQIKQDAIQRPEDFLHMTANVTFFDDNAQEAQVAIRGQGAARTADQSVAFVLDGVQLSSQKLFDNNLFDIDQIEVFKGPQSTIYGRNASAGAIVITTKRPTDTPAGEVYVGYGSFNTAFADAAYSGPIAPGLKFRLSTSVARTDGPYEDITTHTTVRAHQDIAGRLTLQYDPTDTLRLTLRLAALHSTGDGLAYNAQFVGLPIGGVPVPAADANQTNIPFVTAIRGQGNRTIYDGNLTIEKDLGFAKLISVTDYSYLSALEYAGDLIPYNSVTVTHKEGTQSDYVVNKSFSEDIRLASPSTGWFRWMIGGYYLHLDKPQTVLLGENDALVALPANFGLQPPGSINPTISIVDDIVKDQDYAVYGNVQVDLLHNLELSVAGRYDIEEKSDRELAPNAINPLTGLNYNLCVATLNVPLSQCYEHATFYRFTPKVSLTYRTPLGSLFASWGTGFKSGGFNPIGTRAATVAAAIAAGQPTNDIYVQDNFKTETSETYEVGLKARLFDRRLAINVSGYWTEIKNEQEFVFFPTAGIQAIESIDRVSIKGVDADFTALLPYGITLAGAYGYNDGVIKAFSPNPSFVGNVAPLALKYTVDLSASKAFELTDGFTLTPRLEYQRQGPIFWNSANTPGTERNPVDLLNFSVALRRANWEVIAWGKNVLDKRYNEEYVPLIGILAVLYKADPASFGVTADVRF